MESVESRLSDADDGATPVAVKSEAGTERRERSVGHMLAMMIALAILSQFYRSSNGVIAPELMHELHIGSGDIGWSSGTFFVIFALLQVPIGVFFDRFGARRVVSAMLIFAIAGSWIFASAQSVGVLVFGRFLIGLGFAGGMVGSLVVLSRWQTPAKFTQAMTLLFASANVGSFLATLPLAAANAWIGWRLTFLALGLITAVVGLLFFSIVRDAPPENMDRKRPDSLADLFRGVREVFFVPGLTQVLPMIAIGYASIATIVGLWGGPYFHDVYGLDSVARGNLLSIMAVALVLGTLAYGPIQQRVGRFRPVVIVGGGVAAALMLIVAAFPSAPLPVTVCLLVAICFIGSYSVALMGHGVALIPPRLSGRGTTMLNFVLMGGTAILQISSGEVIGFVSGSGDPTAPGYAAFFLLLGVLTLGAAAIYHRAPEPPSKGSR